MYWDRMIFDQIKKKVVKEYLKKKNDVLFCVPIETGKNLTFEKLHLCSSISAMKLQNLVVVLTLVAQMQNQGKKLWWTKV